MAGELNQQMARREIKRIGRPRAEGQSGWVIAPIASRASGKRAPVKTALIAALLLGLAACGDTKVVQCNSVTAIANTANQAAKPAANGDPKTMLAAAESFDSAAQQLNELRLSDRDLRELRDRLASLYSNTSQSTREFLTAVNQKDRGLAEVSLQALEQSAAEEVTLNQAVNDYCVEATTTAFQSSPSAAPAPEKLP